MNVEVDFISGFMFGIEFFNDEVLFGRGMILDLGIVRIVVSKEVE